MREKQLKITKAIERSAQYAHFAHCINEPSGSLQKEHILIRYDDAARAFILPCMQMPI